MNNEKPIIIDWVDSSDGNICADVYRSYLLYLQFSSELAELYLNLYSKKSNINKKEILVWAPIIAGASLSENLPYEKASLLINIVQENCRLEYRT
ncbi:MAG: hypothetical protein RR636_11270 [Clostridium sp.]|uniref:hypothetical protein n=1 Tax=Clostridium sp. TaxID=1506 RepID=UPI0030521299